MKQHRPGELFEKYKAKRLRPSSVVIKDEQKSSHQFYKKKKKNKDIPFISKASASDMKKYPALPSGKATKYDRFTKMGASKPLSKGTLKMSGKSGKLDYTRFKKKGMKCKKKHDHSNKCI